MCYNNYIGEHILDINELIADLWETGEYEWREIAREVNKQTGGELTGNACRKRYKRFNSGSDTNTPDMPEKLLQHDGLRLDSLLGSDSSGSDVISQLRDQFGVSDDYVPKRIKTTTSGDKTWYGAEWERQVVNEDKMEAVLEQIKQHAPTYSEFTPLKPVGGNLLVPILYDAHVDKAALNGGKTYIHVVQEMIETALGLGLQIDRVMFVVGNDFGNFDNVQGNTTAGTSQDNGYHWARAIDVRCRYAISAVEMFASVAPTDVIMVHGNHDRYSNQWLGKVLEAQFHNNQRVTVNNNHSPRKYYAWEANMWGFVHGNEENPAMLPAIMATEAAVQYAFASYREVFTGHFHRKQSAFYPLTEQNGLTIRWMPALSGVDDWHQLKGYVGARRAGLGVVYGPTGYKMEYSVDV